MTAETGLSITQLKLIKSVMNDPIKWSQTFIVSYDAVKKDYTPWIARWYQREMLEDKHQKKVYRCGRRTGKSEVMIIEMLWKIYTNRNYRCLTITPYENQVRLQFQRIKELVNQSPLLKAEIVSFTKNPYQLTLKNDSAIYGFTTGASSGGGAASVRGQRADWLFLDECDYMRQADFDSITAIAAERSDIGITMSSTPTGARAQFYKCCTDPNLHYSQHYHPSTHNPNWNKNMETEFRAQLTEQGYIHEILAEFGTEEAGVFDKNKVDLATTYDCYYYNDLDYYQQNRVKESKLAPVDYRYNNMHAPMNPIRTVGVDWDKYGATSSILILCYDRDWGKFRVEKTIQVPRGEYSFDNAVKMIIQVNEKYNPAWIYCDAGAGEHQIESLHIYGDEHPSSGLKNKVKRQHFGSTLDIIDSITGEVDKKPFKPFMVTQLQIAFERENIILSPFDELLYKQLIDYKVDKFTGEDRRPVFTSENEHFVDALGLAYLAMVLEFKELTNMLKDRNVSTDIVKLKTGLGEKSINEAFSQIQSTDKMYNKMIQQIQRDKADGDLPGDRPNEINLSLGNIRRKHKYGAWGSRSIGITSRNYDYSRKTW